MKKILKEAAIILAILTTGMFTVAQVQSVSVEASNGQYGQ